MTTFGAARRTLAVTVICAAGLMLSACEEYYAPPPPSPQLLREHHVRWCYDHHGGYNPASNVYIAEDGSPHYCIAPWER